MIEIENYNGQFVQYEAIHDYTLITDFMKEKTYSNLSNYKYLANKLISYEKTRNYIAANRSKVYAISLLIMLPIASTKDQKHQIVKNFMLNISVKYKQILYLYHFERHGKGSYCRIIAFERQVYAKSHYVYECYKRDMFINKKTGRTTSSSDPDCIHLCKKGELKKDQNGNPIQKKVEISPKKYKYLKFKDNLDSSKKLENFVDFKDKLTKKLVKAIEKIIHFASSLKLRNFSYKNGKISNKIIRYNSMINRLNIMLVYIQRLFNYKYAFLEEEKARIEFKILFLNINNNIEKREYKFKNLFLNINPEEHISIKQYEQNLLTYEKLTKRKIEQFLFDHFYDPLFDDFYKETHHPFSTLKIKER